MESLFGSPKSGLVHRATFPTLETARRALFEHAETFQCLRRHSGSAP